MPDVDEICAALGAVGVALINLYALSIGWKPSGGIWFFVAEFFAFFVAFLALNPYVWAASSLEWRSWPMWLIGPSAIALIALSYWLS